MHDGKRLVLTSQLVNRMLRMAMSPALEDGMAYAYARVRVLRCRY